MLKKGNGFILLLLTLALSASALTGCNKAISRKPLEGYQPSQTEAQSNGGFVVKKDNWYYFINGAEEYSADNTFGNVVKGALVRISEENLKAGKYTATDIVVPQLIVAQDYSSGIYVYGDYVYYATPNTTKNMEGEVEKSYLDFKRSKLDGSETMSSYYVQSSDNTVKYRYVRENETVYLLYVDNAAKEIHSVNTESGVNTVLVKGYEDYAFDTNLTSPTVYYTMGVAKKNTYPNVSYEKYNQLYKVTASATEAPALDLKDGYTDISKKEGEEGYQMEYINLGKLVLDGIGSDCAVTPFNPDRKADTVLKSVQGYKYDIVQMNNQTVIFTVKNLIEDSVTFVYSLEDAAVGANWNTVAENPVFSEATTGAVKLVSVSADKATENALFYTKDGAQYYICLDSANSIQRIKAGSAADDETVTLAKKQEGAKLLYVEGDYLYFSKAGTNGSALYRINYTGTEESYSMFGDAYSNDDYKPTKYLALDYNSSWYIPEVVDGHLFFSNAEKYADKYVYILDNPETNAELKELNDKYDEVQDTFTEIDKKFKNASNAAKYYFYTGSDDVLNEEDHKEMYQTEDLEVFNAFAKCEDSHGFKFSNLKDGNEKYNVQSYYYGMAGQRKESDAEALQKSLSTDLLLSKSGKDEKNDEEHDHEHTHTH